MVEFKSDDIKHVVGRGEVTIVDRTKQPGIDNVHPGDIISMDGEAKIIKSIEKSYKLMDPPIPGDHVGLLLMDPILSDINYSC